MKFPQYKIKSGQISSNPKTGYRGPDLWPPLTGQPVGPIRNRPIKKRRITYSRGQLFEINEAKYWKSKWQTMEDDMSAALVENRKQASKLIKGLHELLRMTVRTWPETMTVAEIRTLVVGLVQMPGDAKPRTMLKRLTRLKMVQFDQHTRLWLNLCHLPAE